MVIIPSIPIDLVRKRSRFLVLLLVLFSLILHSYFLFKFLSSATYCDDLILLVIKIERKCNC